MVAERLSMKRPFANSGRITTHPVLTPAADSPIAPSAEKSGLWQFQGPPIMNIKRLCGLGSIRPVDMTSRE
jgi:hypothetical protein